MYKKIQKAIRRLFGKRDLPTPYVQSGVPAKIEKFSFFKPESTSFIKTIFGRIKNLFSR